MSCLSSQRWQFGSDAAQQDADLSDFRVKEPRLSLLLNTDFTSAEKKRPKSLTVWEVTLSRRFFLQAQEGLWVAGIDPSDVWLRALLRLICQASSAQRLQGTSQLPLHAHYTHRHMHIHARALDSAVSSCWVGQNLKFMTPDKWTVGVSNFNTFAQNRGCFVVYWRKRLPEALGWCLETCRDIQELHQVTIREWVDCNSGMQICTFFCGFC